MSYLSSAQKDRKISGSSMSVFSHLNENATKNLFSVVIVVKDASSKIARLLQSIQGLTDDVIVCDTGSTDNTLDIVKSFPVRLFQTTWKGYGISKNEAIGYAKYDWILSLDSDEKIDQRLYQQLKEWQVPSSADVVYRVRWKNFLGTQWIKHSQWGANWKNRLFNKHVVRWDNAIAHEDICSDQPLTFVKLNGFLEHFSFSNTSEYVRKMDHSASITAKKYHSQQRTSTLFHLCACPLFTYVKLLLVHLAFLDGRAGWLIARVTARYTYLKYARLRMLNKKGTSDVSDFADGRVRARLV